MTFNQEVKRELCRLESRRTCCEWAQLYAMLVFSRSFPEDEVIFTTENKTAADAAAQRLAGLAGAFSAIRTDFRRLKEETPRYTVCVEDEAQRELLAERFSLQFPALVPAYLEQDCCVSAFFRGIFLLYGSVTNPEKEYHLELGAPGEELAEETLLLGKTRGIHFKLTHRKGAPLLYLKESEQIEDFPNCGGTPVVSLNSQITYLSAAKGKTLFAEARRIRQGRRTGYYRITVSDELGTMAAEVVTTGFVVEK